MKKKNVSNAGGIQGLTFGIMEGTILLLGLMLGMSVTNNRAITALALMVTAFADALANSAGFHVSQETESKERKEVWASTIYCFAATLLVMGLLVIPILVFENFSTAILVSSGLAIIVLGLLGTYVAGKQREPAWKISLEYIAMGLLVAVVSYLLGNFAETIIQP